MEQSGARGRCILKATHKDPEALLFWHLDGVYIGTTSRFHQLPILPGPGLHVIQVNDEAGESVRCKFEVVGK